MKRNTSLLVVAFAAHFALYGPVYGQKKAAAKKAPTTTAVKSNNAAVIPNDPNVKIGKLANGLTYYIRKNAEPNNRAELYLANRIGSLMEDDAQQGLAHFTEHMAFNGSKDFPKNEMINYLQRAGVRFGADLNAYTGFNQTVYQLPIPTDSVEVFKTGFKILANWAGKISMEAEEIDRERGVIIEEDRQRGKDAKDRMSKQLYPLLLKGSRYENRIPIGKIDILNNFTHDKIRSFYSDWYRPNLQAVIAVGDFDVNQVEQLIKDNFSELKNPANPRPRLNYDLPDNKEPLAKVITDAEQPYNVAMVIYKQRGGVVKTTADYKKSLMYGMINNMLGARIQEILQKGNAPFLFAQSNFGSFQGGLVAGINAFQTVVASKSGTELNSALAAALAENERMTKFGFLQSELDVVKKNIAAGNEKQLKEKDKTPSSGFVQQYLENFLTGESIPSIEFAYEQTKKDLANITLAEVNALAKTLITKENQIIIVQAPEKEKANLPTETQLVATLKAAATGVTAYVDNSVNKPLLDKKPVAGKIVGERKLDAIGVTELTLSNGIKVLLKPTDFQNDQVIFSSFSKGGISLASEADLQSAQSVGLISQSGVGEFNPTQLNKLLAGNTGRGGAYVNDLYQGFSGSAAPKDIETAFQMVYAYATNPRKDEEIFNKNISDSRIMMANKNDDPGSVFSDTVQAVLSNYNKRAMPTTLADLDQISLDKSLAFYKDRFADNGEQTFVIVGAFDANTIKPMIETYIASLPTLGNKQNWVDNGINPPKGKVSKTVYKGLEDKAEVQLYIHGDYDYTADNNVQLSALKGALEIKIMERLREKESGVYSPNVGLSVQKYPTAHYYFTVSFSCATANVDKLVAAALEEIAAVRTNGATADDISKFKSEEQRQMELSLRNNNFWLGTITNRAKNGDDINQPVDIKSRLSKVTVESSKAAAQKFLTEDNYIRLVLAPQK
ncbi:putative zinc protease [Pedobacter sp. BAL39]|uniref:M16 family metallopeptidase n=1 Tax=Pedobacter sp. BAL39 TaxID=391596 RepID=UPI000155A6D4|nr:M16 family metallopeptidase [Pedobacter sp. BAL39]EDM33960.1 putative zinc protease [Pedobacter sp. BAL39]